MVANLLVDRRWRICRTAGGGRRSWHRDTGVVRQPWWRAPSSLYAAGQYWSSPSAVRRWRWCAHAVGHRHLSPSDTHTSPTHSNISAEQWYNYDGISFCALHKMMRCHYWQRNGLAIHMSRVRVLTGYHGVVALGKLLTPGHLCHQAV